MHSWDEGAIKQHPRAFHIVIPKNGLPRLSEEKWAKQGHNMQGKIMWVLPAGRYPTFERLYHKTLVGTLRVFTNYDPKKERAEGGDIRKDASFLYKAEDRQIVYGVVMVPWEPDTQGDFQTPEVIEQAAHRWLARYRLIGEQHGKLARETEVVESFIAPQDIKVGGQEVPKGSWVLGTHVLNSGLWKDIRAGKYTGYSIGGYGQSRPATQEDMMRLKEKFG